MLSVELAQTWSKERRTVSVSPLWVAFKSSVHKMGKSSHLPVFLMCCYYECRDVSIPSRRDTDRDVIFSLKTGPEEKRMSDRVNLGITFCL